MICIHCNYVLSDFDIECPRCHGKGLPTAKATPLTAPAPTIAPASLTTPASSTPTAPENALSVLQVPPEQVANAPVPVSTVPRSPIPRSPQFSSGCPNCGNANVQKVSAIVSAGTWNEDTSWSQQTQIDTQNSGASFGVVWGDKHSSPVTSVSGGHTKGHADSFGFGSTTGATRLASLLAPPPSPRAPVKKVVSDGEGMWLVGMPCFLLLGWYVGSFAWWVVPMAIFCFLLLWGIVEGNKETYKKAGSQFQENRKSWGLNYSRWNKLFYCARCDRVFMPETGRSEVVGDITFLVHCD